MKRTIVTTAAVALLVALPASAAAADWRGVVVAKDQSRTTLVTASRGGVVRTVRAPGKLRGVRVGARVVVRARPLADGTFAAQKVRRIGRASHARVRAVVVAAQARRTLVTAGGTVFAIRSGGRKLAAAGDGLAEGDRIVADVTFVAGVLQADEDDVDEIGHANALELEGIFLGAAEGTLELAVVHRGAVGVVVPAGMTLPSFTPGDQISLLVSLGTDGVFTLVNAQDDHSGEGDHGFDFDEDEEEAEVEGVLTALSSSSVTVQPGKGATALTCVVPAGFELAGFAVTDVVEAECRFDGTAFFLTEMEAEDDDDDEHEQDEDEHDEDEHEDGEDDDD